MAKGYPNLRRVDRSIPYAVEYQIRGVGPWICYGSYPTRKAAEEGRERAQRAMQESRVRIVEQ